MFAQAFSKLAALAEARACPPTHYDQRQLYAFELGHDSWWSAPAVETAGRPAETAGAKPPGRRRKPFKARRRKAAARAWSLVEKRREERRGTGIAMVDGR